MADRPGILSRLMRRMHAPIYASRQAELVRQIVPWLEPGDRVLDVGCGFGGLGRAILDDRRCPGGVEIRGLERNRREPQLIPVDEYDGVTIPLTDGAVDVVILADVIHHERNPHQLLDECARVARRRLIVNDHQRAGLLAQARISLIDWAANAPYDVPCLYQYNTREQWRQ